MLQTSRARLFALALFICSSGPAFAQQPPSPPFAQPSQPFVYHDRGSMAIIGRGSAIADIRGLRFSGPVAWLAWLFLHIFELIGFRNRLVVMIAWATAYFTRQRSVRLITYQDH